MTDQQQQKTKGVADIVFLIDATGSMTPCIEALKQNIGTFIDYLVTGDPNGTRPVQDWRCKVVGYRDFDESEPEPFLDNPFVRDAAAVKQQLAQLEAKAGGDVPESLLDALYRVASMGATDKGAQSLDDTKWRYRSDAARVVIVFTDAAYKPTMTIPEAKGGTVDDVTNVLMSNRIVLSLFAPNDPGYERLSEVDRSEWEVVEYPGLSPQDALAKYTADQANFKNTLKQLAASVSKSAEVLAV